jgi:hypothetical protein
MEKPRLIWTGWNNGGTGMGSQSIPRILSRDGRLSPWSYRPDQELFSQECCQCPARLGGADVGAQEIALAEQV